MVNSFGHVGTDLTTLFLGRLRPQDINAYTTTALLESVVGWLVVFNLRALRESI